MKYFSFMLALSWCLGGCSKHGGEPLPTNPVLEIKAADLSYLPLVRASGITIKNAAGNPEDMLTTLKASGANCVRLRLWHSPADATSSFAAVKALAAEIKSRGLKLWLTVHYSDTWADPGTQQLPAAWVGISFTALKDSVAAYSQKIALEIKPDYVQIGNEINDGFLWPQGKMSSNLAQCKALLGAAAQAFRTHAASSKIILHCAGYTDAPYFFNTLSSVDYDVMAISYYPLWHGKDLLSLKTALTNLVLQNNKPLIIAETAYPFTLGYNDYTNNIVGLSSQLISNYAASPQGQKDFLQQIKNIVTQTNRGLGFCYWGAEWIALYGPTATNGSTWENQALWDFNNQALPAMEVFKD